jgi:hypothetical protein
MTGFKVDMGRKNVFNSKEENEAGKKRQLNVLRSNGMLGKELTCGVLGQKIQISLWNGSEYNNKRDPDLTSGVEFVL